MRSARHRQRGLKIVALGGGTGLPVVLRGLKRALADVASLTAIVTVSDDGGSSGRLRRDLNVLAMGDIRNCLVALSENEPLMSRLFQYRYPGRKGLAGHSAGNLILTALAACSRSWLKAIETSGEVLAIRGRILPATLAKSCRSQSLILMKGPSSACSRDLMGRFQYTEPSGGAQGVKSVSRSGR